MPLMKNQPRSPTEKERNALVSRLIKQGMDKQEASLHVDRANIAVFDDYTVDAAGYEGKMVVVVWRVEVTRFQAFTLNGERLICFEKQPNFEWWRERRPLAEMELSEEDIPF